jgi:hypothetical protein
MQSSKNKFKWVMPFKQYEEMGKSKK